jgi:hypothetical protein
MVPLKNSSQFAGWPLQRVAPCFLLGLALLLIALGLLLSIRSDNGDGVRPSTTITPWSLSGAQTSFNSPDSNLHLNGFERTQNLASILTDEWRFDHRGIPDRGDLPSSMLFIALGLSILWVPRKLEYLEDDSPGVRLRVCRARPPTFR